MANPFSIDDFLRYVHTTVADMLKFAEAKNGAIFVVNVGLLGAIANTLVQLETEWPALIVAYSVLGIGCFLLSASLAAYSFLPKIKIPWERGGHPGPFDNLTFFGDIAKYPVNDDTYLLAVINHYCDDDSERRTTEFRSHLAQQTVVNSQIALRKFRLFTISLTIALVPVVLPISPLLGLAYIAARIRYNKGGF